MTHNRCNDAESRKENRTTIDLGLQRAPHFESLRRGECGHLEDCSRRFRAHTNERPSKSRCPRRLPPPVEGRDWRRPERLDFVDGIDETGRDSRRRTRSNPCLPALRSKNGSARLYSSCKRTEIHLSLARGSLGHQPCQNFHCRLGFETDFEARVGSLEIAERSEPRLAPPLKARDTVSRESSHAFARSASQAGDEK